MDEGRDVELEAAIKDLLKVPNDGGKVLTAINTLLAYVGNVLKTPDDTKFYKIGALNKAFHARIAAIPQALVLVRILGWEAGIEKDFFVLKGMLSVATKVLINFLHNIKFVTNIGLGCHLTKITVRQKRTRQC